MNYYYSPSENAFFLYALKGRYDAAGSWPTDAVGVSDDVFFEYGLGLPPAGKERAAVNGMPGWVDIPARSTTTSDASATS